MDVRCNALGRENGAWDMLVTLIQKIKDSNSPFAIGMADFVIVGDGAAEVVDEIVGVVCTSIVLVV